MILNQFLLSETIFIFSVRSTFQPLPTCIPARERTIIVLLSGQDEHSSFTTTAKITTTKEKCAKSEGIDSVGESLDQKKKVDSPVKTEQHPSRESNSTK